MPWMKFKKAFRGLGKLFGKGGRKKLSPEQAEKLKGMNISQKMLAGPLAIAKAKSPAKASMGDIAGVIGKAATGKLAGSLKTKEKDDEDEKKKRIGAGIKAMRRISPFKKGGSVSKKPMAAKKPAAKKTVSKGRGMGAATRGGGACAPRKMMGGGYAKKMAKGGMC